MEQINQFSGIVRQDQLDKQNAEALLEIWKLNRVIEYVKSGFFLHGHFKYIKEWGETERNSLIVINSGFKRADLEFYGFDFEKHKRKIFETVEEAIAEYIKTENRRRLDAALSQPKTRERSVKVPLVEFTLFPTKDKIELGYQLEVKVNMQTVRVVWKKNGYTILNQPKINKSSENNSRYQI